MRWSPLGTPVTVGRIVAAPDDEYGAVGKIGRGNRRENVSPL
jgi:hypothetical protein